MTLRGLQRYSIRWDECRGTIYHLGNTTSVIEENRLWSVVMAVGRCVGGCTHYTPSIPLCAQPARLASAALATLFIRSVLDPCLRDYLLTLRSPETRPWGQSRSCTSSVWRLTKFTFLQYSTEPLSRPLVKVFRRTIMNHHVFLIHTDGLGLGGTNNRRSSE